MSRDYNLVEELSAFDSRWQTNYATMRAAARAAGLEGVYDNWLQSTDGRIHLAATSGVHEPVRELRELPLRGVGHEFLVDWEAYDAEEANDVE